MSWLPDNWIISISDFKIIELSIKLETVFPFLIPPIKPPQDLTNLKKIPINNPSSEILAFKNFLKPISFNNALIKPSIQK